MDLSVIIVNWNTRQLLLNCLKSLYRTTPASLLKEVWVVDNGSTDGSAAAVLETYPEVEIIANETNLGFARACNQALRRVRAPYVLLLNTDVVLQEEAVSRLLGFIRSAPQAAMVGGQLLHGDGQPQNSFAAIPDLLTELTHKGLLRFFFPSRYPRKVPRIKERRESGAAEQRRNCSPAPLPNRPTGGSGPREVDSLVGACMLLRMEAIGEVGLLDERYFFFLEETDWCHRFRKAGWKIYWLPEARIVHLQGQSAKRQLARARVEYHRSRLLFFRKHRGWMARATLRAGLFFRAFWDFLFLTALNLLTGFASRRYREKLSVYLWVLLWYLRLCPEGMGLKKLEIENWKLKIVEDKVPLAASAEIKRLFENSADPPIFRIGSKDDQGPTGAAGERLADWLQVERQGVRWWVRPDWIDRLPAISALAEGQGGVMVKENRVRRVVLAEIPCLPQPPASWYEGAGADGAKNRGAEENSPGYPRTPVPQLPSSPDPPAGSGGPGSYGHSTPANFHGSPNAGVYLKTYRIPSQMEAWIHLFRPSRARKEGELALALLREGIPTIVPMALGEKRGRWLLKESYLATEEIPGTEPLGNCFHTSISNFQFSISNFQFPISNFQFSGASSPELLRRKRALTYQLAQLTCRLHEVGIYHRDFHAGNLLLQRTGEDPIPISNPSKWGRLFLIDLHSARRVRKMTLPRRLRNLVQLNVFFLTRLNAPGRLRFFQAYRTHSQEPSLLKHWKRYARLVERRSGRARLRLLGRRDERCMRENQDFLPFKDRNCRGYLGREATRKAAVEGYLRDPQLLWQEPKLEVIKRTPSLTTARLPLSLNGEPTGIFAKGYRISGPWGLLKERLRGPAAFRAWRAAHALARRELRVADPLGVSVKRSGPLSREGLFLTREIPAAMGIDWFVLQELDLRPFSNEGLERRAEASFLQQRKRAFVRQFSQLIRRLHAQGIYHPDLKASNVLVVKGGGEGEAHLPIYHFYLVDLERVKIGQRLRHHQWIRNLSQINASFTDTRVISRTDRLRFLKEYLPLTLKGRKAAGLWKPCWREIQKLSQERLERAGRAFHGQK